MELFFFLFIGFLFWMVFAGNKEAAKTKSRARQNTVARQSGIDRGDEPSVWESSWQSGGGTARTPSTLSPEARERAMKTTKAAARMAATRLGQRALADDRNLSRRIIPNGRARELVSGKTATMILGLSGLALYVLSLF